MGKSGKKRKAKPPLHGETRTDYVHGPASDPKGKTALAKKAREDRKLTKLELLTSIKECIWVRSSRGGLREKNNATRCCVKDCVHAYARPVGGRTNLASCISRVREKYFHMSKDQRREWWVERIYYTGYDREAGKPRKGTRDNVYMGVRPDLFKRRALLPTTVRLQAHDAMPCCMKWLLFICGGHSDTIYDNTIRKAARASGKDTAENRDPAIPPTRNIYGMGAKKGEGEKRGMGKKRQSTLGFLRRQGELGCILPNDPRQTVVLPFRTRGMTHAYYVFETEKEAGCTWAQMDDETFLLNNLSDVDDNSREEDCGASDPDRPEETAKPQGYCTTHEQNCFTSIKRSDNCCRGTPPRKNSVESKTTDDSSVSDSDLEDIRANVRASKTKKAGDQARFRYGNPLCGLKDGGEPCLSTIAQYSWFLHCWAENDETRKLLCREDLPFAKCDICVRHRETDVLKLSPDEKTKHLKKVADHLKEVKHEKQAYYTHRDKARREPKRFTSIIIDGADQSKYQLPHFSERCHKSEAVEIVKMHLYGVLVHGRGAYGYLCGDHEEQGHNATINILWKVLMDLLKDGPLSSVLFLQLDNTRRQNKGQFLFGFLDLLVEYGVFERVYVCFLPVGHTHEDIDQMFSRIALALRFTNAFSPRQLMNIIRRAYHFEGYETKVEYITTWANFSAWLKPFTESFSAGVCSFRHFRFFRSVVTRKVWLQACSKMSSFGNALDPWRGLQMGKTPAKKLTHTEAFSTQFGIPNLEQTIKRDPGSLPRAAKRKVNMKALKAQIQAIHDLTEHRPIFTSNDALACVAVLELYKKSAADFKLDPAEVNLFFGRGVAPGEAVSAQQALGLNEPNVDEYFIARPPDDADRPFWFGQVRAITTLNSQRVARMSWYIPKIPRHFDCIKGVYVPKDPTALVPNLPTVGLNALQCKVQCAKVVTDDAGRVQQVKISKHSHNNVKYYVEAFRHADDMIDHPDEIVQEEPIVRLSGPCRRSGMKRRKK